MIFDALAITTLLSHLGLAENTSVDQTANRHQLSLRSEKSVYKCSKDVKLDHKQLASDYEEGSDYNFGSFDDCSIDVDLGTQVAKPNKVDTFHPET